jgi:REP element-mobilizing transposase RayT
MPNTYTQLYIHIVLVVKSRQNLILKSWEEDLYKYITGIIKNNGQKLIIINGYKDHIHVLVGLSTNITVADLVRVIKTNSSKWINQNKFVKGKFEWQKGYAAFTIGQSQMNKTFNYIENQKEHHKTKSFESEYISFLKAYKIDYDERYILKVE